MRQSDFNNGGNFKFSSWDKYWNVHVITVTIQRRISFLVPEWFPGFSIFQPLIFIIKQSFEIDINDLVEVVERRNLIIISAKVNKLKGDGKIPYFVKGMFKKGLIKDIPITNSPLYLQRKNNYCPKCGKYRMKFAEIGLFD